VYECLHQAAPTYLAELCSPVSESASRGHLRLLHGVTLQYHVPEQQDTAKDLLLFLDQRCGTYSQSINQSIMSLIKG